MIYEKIRNLCEKKGISVYALEKSAGLGNGTIGGWKTSSPTLDKLQSVANVLEVEISVLVMNADKENFKIVS